MRCSGCGVTSTAGKRRVTFTIIYIYFFLKGVEYSIILPTAWKFLQTFGTTTLFFGFVIAGYNLAALITAPPFGWWFDKKPHQIRLILVIANMAEIVGNLLYFVGKSHWMLLIGRFAAGLGVGVVGSVYGYVARVTEKEKRTGMFALAFLVRLLGIIVGPACNLFLRKLDFMIGPFAVNKYTSPGLLMAVSWVILNFPIWFNMYSMDEMNEDRVIRFSDSVTQAKVKDVELKDVAPADVKPAVGEELDNENNNTDDEGTPIVEPKVTPKNGQKPKSKEDSDQKLGHEQKSLLNGDVTPRGDVAACSDTSHCDGKENGVLETEKMIVTSDRPRTVERSTSYKDKVLGTVRSYTRTRAGRAKLVLTVMPFLILNHLAIETFLPTYTEDKFGFDEFYISIMYLVGGVETILVLFSLRFVSKKVSDRKIMLTGLVLSVFAMAWGLVFLPRPFHAFPGLLTEFIILGFFHLLGTPMVIVSQAALLSKMTSESEQGRSQGIRTSIDCVASILGPIFAGWMAHILYALFSILLFIAILFTVLFALSYKQLKYTETAPEGEAAGEEVESRNRIYTGPDAAIPTVTGSTC